MKFLRIEHLIVILISLIVICIQPFKFAYAQETYDKKIRERLLVSREISSYGNYAIAVKINATHILTCAACSAGTEFSNFHEEYMHDELSINDIEPNSKDGSFTPLIFFDGTVSDINKDDISIWDIDKDKELTPVEVSDSFQCNENTCSTNDYSIPAGSPVFFRDQLVCINTYKGCSRKNIKHSIRKRHVLSGCTTTKEGDCEITNCDECDECLDGKKCTIKSGDCDNKWVYNVYCSNGGKCESNTPPFSKCLGGHCTKGACGKDCPGTCTVEPGNELNWDCTIKCDNPPTEAPDTSFNVVYYAIGGAFGGFAVIGVVCTIGCAVYSHYRPLRRSAYSRIQ